MRPTSISIAEDGIGPGSCPSPTGCRIFSSPIISTCMSELSELLEMDQGPCLALLNCAISPNSDFCSSDDSLRPNRGSPCSTSPASLTSAHIPAATTFTCWPHGKIIDRDERQQSHKSAQPSTISAGVKASVQARRRAAPARSAKVNHRQCLPVFVHGPARYRRGSLSTVHTPDYKFAAAATAAAS